MLITGHVWQTIRPDIRNFGTPELRQLSSPSAEPICETGNSRLRRHALGNDLSRRRWSTCHESECCFCGGANLFANH